MESYRQSDKSGYNADKMAIPNAFQMHWAYFDDRANLFAFQDTVPATSRHSSDVE